jgi:hypothetical protein
MTDVAIEPRSFDAVVAFWTLIHVRRELHAGILGRIHGWLRPGGFLAGTFGSGDNPAQVEERFYGAPMYWSHFDADTIVAFSATRDSNSCRRTRSRTRMKRRSG